MARNKRRSEWFDEALRSAKQRADNRYLDQLQAGGSLPGMLRFMASEYGGPGGAGSATTQQANLLKRHALLRAAELIEQGCQVCWQDAQERQQ